MVEPEASQLPKLLPLLTERAEDARVFQPRSLSLWVGVCRMPQLLPGYRGTIPFFSLPPLPNPE